MLKIPLEMYPPFLISTIKKNPSYFLGFSVSKSKRVIQLKVSEKNGLVFNALGRKDAWVIKTV